MHVDVLFISHALLYKVNLFYNLCQHWNLTNQVLVKKN